jgi:hypothetical protein
MLLLFIILNIFHFVFNKILFYLSINLSIILLNNNHSVIKKHHLIVYTSKIFEIHKFPVIHSFFL